MSQNNKNDPEIEILDDDEIIDANFAGDQEFNAANDSNQENDNSFNYDENWLQSFKRKFKKDF